MSDLTDFLLARIDDDERAARKLAEVDRRPVLSLAMTVNHPERLLLEIEAKRRIVEDMGAKADVQGGGYDDAVWMASRHLAAVYADHRDYDESWRP